jgi:hypothetical protein
VRRRSAAGETIVLVMAQMIEKVIEMSTSR